ncbi:twin-arginine translocase subunit TatC [Piscicoccus intestinalis]|uniref:twin-arginine translocase subunit TatC n=1 Tax=Piscicoccus intestinalis TaxID=746033 RepID=UPI000A803AAA|nr:twin-arginine translocase subunit TatC [Piscicoccus intestinalis]
MPSTADKTHAPAKRRKVRVPRRKKRDPEGRMSLGDHLRELRNRFIVALLAIVAGGVVGWIEYEPLLSFLTEPLRIIGRGQGWGEIGLNYQGLTTPFGLQLTVALWLGVIVASPVWLWQIWAFIVPGLTKKEKRTAVVFILAAVPLFLAGCALANYVLPTAVRVLIDFTPQHSWNLIPADQYLAFVTRFILAFGVAFLVPVLLVGLNYAHVLPAHIMIKGWRIAIILNFVFAAMMTPTPDAWTMIALAMPMCGLYFAACGIAYLIDRRRAKNRPEWADLPDERASEL